MKGWYASCVLVGVLALGGVVAAAGLSDFKNAEGKRGCESIPYDSYLRSCKDNSSEVESWCKSSSRKISCDDLDPTGLAKQIENVKRKIEDLKRERDELTAKISNAKEDGERRDLEDKKKAKENEIYELDKKVSEWERKLSDEKTEIGNQIYNGERCVGYREAVAKAFLDAKSNAKSERDPEIKPYAEKLVRYWEDEEPGHATAIRYVKEAVASCKNIR